MASFCQIRNLFVRAGKAYQKDSKTMNKCLGMGLFLGFTLTGFVDLITWGISTSLPDCAMGNWLIKNGRNYNCNVTGDPCDVNVGGNPWGDGDFALGAFRSFGKSTSTLANKNQKPVLSYVADDVNLQYSCTPPDNANQLKDAANTALSQQATQAQSDYFSWWGYTFTIGLPILGSILGTYLGLRCGISWVEEKYPELSESLLPTNPRHMPASNDASPTSRNTSGFHSPTNPNSTSGRSLLTTTDVAGPQPMRSPTAVPV